MLELLKQLDQEYRLGRYIYDQEKNLSDAVRIILRGRDIRFLSQPELQLKESDIVLIMPILGGG